MSHAVIGFTVLLIYEPVLSDSGDPKKTEHLRALDGANERLHLFKANLLEEGSFDPVAVSYTHLTLPTIYSV